MKRIPSSAERLLKDHAIISQQMDRRRLKVILRELEKVLASEIEGEVVEFGCYSGTTSLFIRRMLDAKKSHKQFHVYDSFKGLPPKSIKDASVAGSQFKAGELMVPRRAIVRNFKQAGLILPEIHRGWFAELGSKNLPDKVAFAFLDGDFYNSILQSLELVWPVACSGGEVVIDDYERSNLPGVSRAVNEFFAGTNVDIRQEDNLALITKPLG